MKYWLVFIMCLVGCQAQFKVNIKSSPSKTPRFGTAVVVLVDTSGSMDDAVHDGVKSRLAKQALLSIAGQAEDWRQKHPDSVLEMGLYTFADGVQQITPIKKFNDQEFRNGITKISRPGGGTALGRAINTGFEELYKTDLTRKFFICVTDGVSTVGPTPEETLSALHAQTHGEVKVEFVAFDTSLHYFSFLPNVNGEVVGASSGQQLTDALQKIFEQKILAEEEP